MALTPHLTRSFPCALAACLVAALAAPGSASAQAPARKALINADTVAGGQDSPSQEEAIATALGFAVTVVSDETWASYSAADFGQYDLLIAGDPTCGVLPPGLVSSAATYGPVVLGAAGGRTQAGNRIVVGTDPVLHDGGDYTSPGAEGTIIREGIAYAAASPPGSTGMYFDSTCGAHYFEQSAETLAILTAISAGAGSWTIDVSEDACGDSVALIAAHPSFTDLTTASLEGWGCSVHEAFPTFPLDWSALAVATDTETTPTCGVDPATGLNACGEAYILIAGSSIVVDSKVISVSPLESTNPVGSNHTITANVHAIGGTPPVVGQLVDFSVTGQNAGAKGTCVPTDCRSDVNGDVAFTYFGGAGAGDDTIKASFTDNAGSLQAATAQKRWIVDFPSMTFGDWVEDVEVDQDFTPQETEVRTAYLALQSEGVKILDVTDPKAITTLGSYAPTTCWNGSSTVGFFADDVEFVESRSALFVAAGRCGVIVLDVSDPAAIDVLGSFDTPVWAEAVEIVLSGDSVIGYIADHNGGLVIVDFTDLFASSPSAPVLLGAIGSSTTGWGTGAAIDVAFSDNFPQLVFVAASQGLRVVDVSDPASPQLTGGLDTNPSGTPPEVPQDISLSEDGNTAFIGGWQAGLLAIDVSDPSEPVLLDRVSTTPGLAYYESEVDGGFVFATEGKGGLRTFVLGEEGLEAIEGREPMPIAGGNGWAWDVQVVDSVAYVTYGILENGTGGLAVIELPRSNPAIDFSSDPAPDGDGDGRPDSEDNCLEVANPGQADANLDGFGDACDADYDDDGAVTAMDFVVLQDAYFSQRGEPHWNAAVDHDGDGTITGVDFAVLCTLYLSPPGPSGLACAGVVPCPSP